MGKERVQTFILGLCLSVLCRGHQWSSPIFSLLLSPLWTLLLSIRLAFLPTLGSLHVKHDLQEVRHPKSHLSTKFQYVS